MKIFRIKNGFCHWDATNQVQSMEEVAERYSPDLLFVEAPDYVFEGWGYDATAEGDARFIRPEPPEGWIYDDATGTMYPADEIPPGTGGTEDVWAELAAAYAEGVNLA